MSEADLFPIALSLRVAGLAMAIVVPLGLILAWVQARRRYRLRALVDALILLPLVLPPSVVGYFLVVVLGQHGPVGSFLAETVGLRLIFSPAGAVVAATLVALPLMVKTAQPAIESVPLELEHVGRSLGLSGLALFARVTLPASWRGVLAGAVLAFARAIGEFGATLMFAGNFPGRTNTMPLEIYSAYQAHQDSRALLYVCVLTAISAGVVLLAARLSPGEQPR